MIKKSNPDEIAGYLVDAANYKGKCSSVYFPQNENEIIDILKEANNAGTPATISGNRTGLTGSAIPSGGIVISTDKLNRIIEINKEEKYSIVQPGVLLNDFQKIIEEKKLLYPPDPTETNCFIGATVSTNASGSKSFKYGPTRNFIIELKVILPDGDILKLIRGENFSKNNVLELTTQSRKQISIPLTEFNMPTTKNAAGYYCKENMDAIDLFIGSEGTLGLFSEIKIKLVDAYESVLSAVIFFTEENDALNFVDEIRTQSKNVDKKIDALAIEFFDKHSLHFLSNEYSNIPANAEAAVWIEHETTKDEENFLFEKIADIISKHNGLDEQSWFALSDKDRARFKDFRHAVSWKVSEYISQHNVVKVGTDSAVPEKCFREFYFFIKEIAEQSRIQYLIYGHFGDCHAHLNLLPKDKKELQTAREAYKIICQKAVDMGGTISAEHGIGKLKHEYLEMMYGKEGIEQMAKIKNIIDPNGILGRGNIFSESYLKEIR